MKDINEMLCGQCWACQHGRPYREQFDDSFSVDERLSICDLGKQGENVIAKVQVEGCKQWKLKQKEA